MNTTAGQISIDGRHSSSVTTDAVSFYEKYWKQGDQATSDSRKRFQQIIDKLFPDGLKSRRILEIGVGGEGGMILHLKNDNCVFGLDASCAAEKNCRRLGLPVAVHNLDRQPLPFADGDLDIVFAMEVFEHLGSPQFVLEEIKRVLKPDGLCIISIPHLLTHHWPRLFYPALFQREAFKEFLMINAFEVMAVQGLGMHWYERYFQQGSDKYWSSIWKCRQMTGSDADIYLQHGRYFWNKKDARGIRLRPMEAIDCFRCSHELNQASIEARLLLARSLIYRFICGETEEFGAHFNYLTQIMRCKSSPGHTLAQYHFAMMFLDLRQLGSKAMHRSDFESVLALLENSGEEGRAYAQKIVKRWHHAGQPA